MLVKEYSVNKVYMVKMDAGSDLYESLSQFVIDENITSGEISVMGLSRNAVFAYYDIKTKKYNEINRDDEYFEIIQCAGNISIKEGKPFIHLHTVFGDKDGNLIGGHQLPGTIVEIGEAKIVAYNGEPMEREFDPKYNITPWKG